MSVTVALRLHRSSWTASRHVLCRTSVNAVPRGSLRSLSTSSKVSDDKPTPVFAQEPFYTGPLASTFRSLKLFSLSSLGLITGLSPVLFIVDAPGIPTSARAAMAATALLTSAASTGLVGWCGAPYVSTMRRLASPQPGTTSNSDAVEMTTKTLFLKDLRTSVYDPSFLGPTSRPFATWELQSQLRVPADGKTRTEEKEEVVARTVDAEGKTRGEWRVTWTKDPTDASFVIGQAGPTGKVVK